MNEDILKLVKKGCHFESVEWSDGFETAVRLVGILLDEWPTDRAPTTQMIWADMQTVYETLTKED